MVASVGTVNTGAVDPLGAITDVFAAHGVWLHVDGAYGGPAGLLLPELTEVREQLRRVDSLALDPHKWFYVPVAAGLVLLRDDANARDAFSLVPAYLQAEPSADEPVWFSEYGLEQTRAFRALKVWAQVRHIGFGGYRELITRDIAVAGVLRTLLEGADDMELLAHGLSIVCFRHRPHGMPPGELDEHNRRLAVELQRDGRAFIASTVVGGVTALRACIVNPYTTSADAAALLEAVRAAG
ncbi:pyridoxal phosphate-dependent decarboxylase family protein [Tomitella gaofuii]|uniref:pyridoxal phosphate-dependent decarboxylase family protein n=1 Tax=Tomitella gaofuii TaxID=2760083 RepID=UPI0015F8281F|nr:pyridoxal-dependent decarboxylase [Tomitella gaofuii]